MTVLFTDDANRSNGAIGGNYTVLAGGFNVVSNQIAPASGDSSAYWNGGTPNADCYFEFDSVSRAGGGTGNYTGMFLRLNTGTYDGYSISYNDETLGIARLDAGVSTTIETTPAPFNNVRVRFQIVGSLLSVYYDGVLQKTKTDSAHSGAGAAGLTGKGTDIRIDNIEIGNYDAPTGPTIDTHPSNQEVTEPAAAVFTSAATSSGGDLSVQWQFDDGGGAEDVTFGSDDETDDYSTGTTSTGMNGWQFRAAYTDDNGTTYTDWATLTVNEAEPEQSPIPVFMNHYRQQGIA